MTRSVSHLRFVIAAAAVLCAAAGVARAHPLSQGALDVVAQPDGRVNVRARITLEEVVITDMLTSVPSSGTGNTTTRPSMRDTYDRHAKYLVEHLEVYLDGKRLAGRVAGVEDELTAAAATQPSTRPLGPDQQHVVYELKYAPAAGTAIEKPSKLELRQDVLVGVEVAPGVTWEASYVVRITAAGGTVTEGHLLTKDAGVVRALDWSATSIAGGAPSAPQVNRWQMARDYAGHGVHHILSGYDHLLFVSALVLAATGLWDLLKVVTAFTIAHTITLALAALRMVSLPDGIVEPMIAGSIVFVAAQNVLWPKQAKGWTRLAAAFGFGLFHGLGFAGGLLDAMQAMSGTTIVLAIAAFSIGVEVGHQLVVIPLFAALKLARRTRPEPEQRDRLSLVAQRYGSAAICVAGMYYLVAAVSSALSVAGHS